MSVEVVVVDYGLGNVRSVANAIECLGARVRISHETAEIDAATHLILPGVGSFVEGMRQLRADGLDEFLTEQVVHRRKPFLGICLGMQLLADHGEESGATTGLGWIGGCVKRLGHPDQPVKVPHMGWNDVVPSGPSRLYEGLPPEAGFYFVHSYHVVSDDPQIVTATCDYGVPFIASLQQGHIFGTQFHPEKSHQVGLHLLRNFLTWPS